MAQAVLYLLLFQYLLKLCASYTTIIELQAEHDEIYVKSKDLDNPSLYLNNKFTIHLSTHSKQTPHSIRCQNSNGKLFFHEELKITHTSTGLRHYELKNEVTVDGSMSTLWYCYLQWKGDLNIKWYISVTVTELTTGVININLENTGDGIEETVQPSVLISDEFIDVIIHCDSCANKINLACLYAENSGTKFFNEAITKKSDSYSYRVKTLKAMNGVWSCNVNLKEYQSHAFNFTVNFLESGLASFKVNDVLLENKIVSNNAEGYTEVANYSYIPGELAKITCSKKNKNFIQMSLKKGDDNSVIDTIPIANQSITLYVRLSEHDQTGYVDCYVKDMTKVVFTIRLQFYSTSHGANRPKVNNLILNRRPDDYFYEYYQGERLVVTSAIKYDQCEPRNLKDISYVSKLNMSFTALEDVNKAHLSCPSAFYISFLKMPSYFDVTVSGLSSAKTMLKYQSKSSEFRIKYSNRNNDNLLLTCSISKSKIDVIICDWLFNDSQVTDRNDLNLEDKNALKRNFTILQNVTKTIVNCTCSRKDNENITTVVEIINENPLLEIPAVGQKSTHPPTATKHSKDKETSDLLTTDTTDYISLSQYFKMSGIIIAAVIIVIAVTWIVVGIYMRKRRLNQSQTQTEDSNINYENLPHKDGAMPPPQQWDREPVYIDSTYSVPYLNKGDEPPKDMPEQPYAELSNIEPNYSTPVKGEPSNEYANLAQETPGYSQVLPKHLRTDGRYQQVLPNMSGDTYAQVLPKEKRPKPADSKYVNVFDNQRYANAATHAKSEYAEPAYCELYKKSK